MSFAIIVKKEPTKTVMRSSSEILSDELQKKATDLDVYLMEKIPEIEQELITLGLLGKNVPKDQSKQGRGNVLLWHALGTRFDELCETNRINGRTHRRWLWEAIENIYATQRIIRSARGRGRIHFEYCYRLSKFPLEFADQLNWSEWSYFFDSRTVREEPRVDKWLFFLIEKKEKITRKKFRQFVQHLNKRTKKLDTSVLSDEELFEIYDKVWYDVKNSPT